MYLVITSIIGLLYADVLLRSCSLHLCWLDFPEMNIWFLPLNKFDGAFFA